MVLCWWCCHDIPGETYHMPYKFEKQQFHTCGHFCSWPCVKAYNIFSNRPQLGTISTLITQYRFKLSGKIQTLNAAPHRFALKAFGGTMTIEEFRKCSSKVNVRQPNEETWRQLTNEVHMRHVVDIEPGELVLKRTKPMKRDVSGIQKILLKK